MSDAYESAVLADSPYYYLRLRDSSGSTAVDDSGSGRTGTYNGSPTLGAAGPFGSGGAVTFNGSSQDVSIPSVTDTTSLTIELWVKGPPAGSAKGALVKLGDISSGYGIGVGSNSSGSWDNAGNYVTGLLEGIAWELLSGAPYLIPGQWHLLHYVLDGSGASMAYVNGVQFARASGSQTPSTPAGSWRIASTGGTNRFFAGSIAEVAIYKAALNSTQINTHLAAGQSLFDTSAGNDAFAKTMISSSPGAYYRLNEASGTTAHDLSGAGNDGTFTGGFTLGQGGPFPDGNKATQFDGSSGYVALPSGLLAGQVGTIVASIYLPGSSGNGMVIKLGNTSTGFGLAIGNADGEHAGTEVVVLYEAVGWYRLTGHPTLTTSAWHQVALTITPDGIYHGYIDGTAYTNANSPGSIVIPDSNWDIAGEPGTGASRFLACDLADIAIYPVPLTTSQLGALWTAFQSQNTPPAAGTGGAQCIGM